MLPFVWFKLIKQSNNLHFIDLPLNAIEKVLSYLDHNDWLQLLITNQDYFQLTSQVIYRSIDFKWFSASTFSQICPMYGIHCKKMMMVNNNGNDLMMDFEMGDLQLILMHCPNLTEFELHCYHVSNMVVMWLSECLSLERVSLSGCCISSTCLPNLMEQCHQLTDLDVAFTQVTDISCLTRLKKLDLSGLHQVDFVGGQWETLILNQTGITDDQLNSLLKSSPNLKNLSVQSNDVSDVAFPVEFLKQVESLDVSATLVTDGLLKKLQDFPHELSLYLIDCCKITLAGLDMLMKSRIEFKELRYTANEE